MYMFIHDFVCFIFVCFFLSIFFQLVKNQKYQTRFYLAEMQDTRVDEFFRKATILGEIRAQTAKIDDNKRITKAIEYSTCIVSDVLLQNGYLPRAYNLRSLVVLHRLQLRLPLVYKEVKQNGKG